MIQVLGSWSALGWILDWIFKLQEALRSPRKPPGSPRSSFVGSRSSSVGQRQLCGPEASSVCQEKNSRCLDSCPVCPEISSERAEICARRTRLSGRRALNADVSAGKAVLSARSLSHMGSQHPVVEQLTDCRVCNCHLLDCVFLEEYALQVTKC